MKTIFAAYVFVILLTCAVRAESNLGKVTIDEALAEARKALHSTGLTEKEFPIDRVWLHRLPGDNELSWFVSFYSEEKGCFLFALDSSEIRREFPVYQFQIEKPYEDTDFTKEFIALLSMVHFEKRSIPWGRPKGW